MQVNMKSLQNTETSNCHYGYVFNVKLEHCKEIVGLYICRATEEVNKEYCKKYENTWVKG